jgi:ribosomal protein L9
MKVEYDLLTIKQGYARNYLTVDVDGATIINIQL